MNHIQPLIHRLQRQPIRWCIPLVWTSTILYLTLSTGNNKNVSWVSKLAGGTEITDALGHFVMFTVLVVLWHWAGSAYYPAMLVLKVVAPLCFIFGMSVEASQHWIEGRGMSWLDFLANGGGVLLGARWILYQLQKD
ncbi:MAG: VanZ family protein [Chloroflexi bacterium]|nr:VanZ family protein [Chloroflexota bacterium]